MASNPSAEAHPRVPRLPPFSALLAQLRVDEPAPAAAAVATRERAGLLACLASFRPRTEASGAALRAHGFVYEGRKDVVPVGADSAPLVARLAPALALEEAQTYLLLRRAYGRQLPAEYGPDVAERVATTLFAERRAAPAVLAQLAAAADGPTDGPPVAGSLAEVLAGLVAEASCIAAAAPLRTPLTRARAGLGRPARAAAVRRT
jgi:hypothetical protein